MISAQYSAIRVCDRLQAVHGDARSIRLCLSRVLLIARFWYVPNAGRCFDRGEATDTLSKGTSLLRSPYFNKGSAFSPEERRDFEIDDLLPSNIGSLDAQIKRAYRQYASRTEPLAKNTFLASMKDQNEVLYYAVRRFVCDSMIVVTDY